MILCVIIIFGSAAINNKIRARADGEVTDILNYKVDKKVEVDEVYEVDEVEDNIENSEVSEEDVSEDIIYEDNKDIEIEEVEVQLDDQLYNNDIDIMERINNYLGDDKYSTSFIYYNLETEEKLAFNEDLYMNAASIYKVGLSLVAYSMVECGEISLDDLVYYSPWQYQGGTGILQYDLSFGALPLGTLIEYTIKYSDNIAAAMVYSYIGGWNNFKWRLFDILGIDYGDYDNVTSARVEFEVLKYIYENRNSPNYGILIDYLKNTEFHDRLDKYLPQSIVAHKIGSDEGYTHDMGIVFTDEPYIIIMMTDNVYNGPDKIADISKAIYLYNKESANNTVNEIEFLQY